MGYNLFENIYRNITFPVIVCEDNEEMTVLFANTEAYLLLGPSQTAVGAPLCRLMHFYRANEQNPIRQALRNTDSLGWYFTTLLLPDDAVIHVKLTANIARHDDHQYIIVYICYDEADNGRTEGGSDILSHALHLSCHATDIGQAVQAIITSVGEYIQVSRVYILEDLYNGYMRDTYEWCTAGIASAMQDLQNLSKADYNDDMIASASGLFVADDISVLPEKDRALLEPQGIKAIAILPLFHQDRLIGYIGYDDCVSTRNWQRWELALLRGVGSIISSLIVRRNEEAEINRAREALQAVSDNIDSAIYVNDIRTYELKFVNYTLAAMFGVTPDELVGKICWQVLQKDMTGPCPFCPIPHLLESEIDACGAREWEHQNTITGGWFWVKDSIIRWVDNSLVHFELAIDITVRKRYEEELHHYASTDNLTGVFNREWGLSLLLREHKFARVTNRPVSLCFIDLDGLKSINDTFGHTAGDGAIIGVSETIRQRVGTDDIVCRWGGDEFIALLKRDVTAADAVMRDIQAALRADIGENAVVPTLAFSYGIADFTAAESVDAAIAAADSSMYRDKSAKYNKRKPK